MLPITKANRDPSLHPSLPNWLDGRAPQLPTFISQRKEDAPGRVGMPFALDQRPCRLLPAAFLVPLAGSPTSTPAANWARPLHEPGHDPSFLAPMRVVVEASKSRVLTRALRRMPASTVRSSSTSCEQKNLHTTPPRNCHLSDRATLLLPPLLSPWEQKHSEELLH
jgi:hypothetical protein